MLGLKICLLQGWAPPLRSVVSIMWLSKNVLSCDDGTAEMRAISHPIREGGAELFKVMTMGLLLSLSIKTT